MSIWPYFGPGLSSTLPFDGSQSDGSVITPPIAVPSAQERPQSNIAVLYENRIDLDGVVFSGGSWQTGSLGLANLRTPYLSEVARSRSAAIADTQFVCALPQPMSLGGFALGPSNLSPTAVLRLRAYLDAGMSQLAYDSGFLNLPNNVVDNLSLAWEDPGFWEGVSAEFDDIGKGIGKGPSFVIVPDNRFTAAYLKVELFDPSNPAGFIDIGRMFASRTWRPTFNYEEDSNSLDFEAISDVEEGRSGTTFVNARAIRRSFKFGFSYLPESEFREIYQIIVRSGVGNQVFVLPNPKDPSTYLREGFFGTLGQPPSIRRRSTPNISTEFVVKESL